MTDNDNPVGATAESNLQLAESLRKIEKRDLWIWADTLLVIVLLTGAVFFSRASLDTTGSKRAAEGSSARYGTRFSLCHNPVQRLHRLPASSD